MNLHRRTGIVILALAAHGVVASAQRPTQHGSINIPYEHYSLANGLGVILSVNHATPTVAVDVWYHVGSKNEQVKRTGFAHLFEHVMFTGSGHVPYGVHDKLTEGVGGSNNGTTNNDRTEYYETVPSNYLESELWLESDRMGYLLDALDSAKLDAQRDIVKNERREGVDNQPYGRVDELMDSTLFPASNPYSWPVIGSMTDLSNASQKDVKDFFRLYYAPDNATLVVAGDFDPSQARRWIEKYFGGIPHGKGVVRPKVPTVSLGAEKRLVYEDRVEIPRLYIRWPTVGERHPDHYALALLGAMLAGPRTARLTRALVYEQQSAASVSARQSTNEDAGAFDVVITPRPGHSLESLEHAADSVIGRLQRDGPTTDELQRAKASAELGFFLRLESNLGTAGQLASGLLYHGDPGYFRTAYRAMQGVTAADVRRVANRYLGPGRVVLSAVPLGKKNEASKADASIDVTTAAAHVTPSRGGAR